MSDDEHVVSDAAAPYTGDAANEGSTFRSGGVRVRILVPFTAIVLLMLVGFAVAISWLAKHQMDEDRGKVFRSIPGAFRMELDKEADMMAATLEAVVGDKSLHSAFASGDANALFAKARPLFDKLRRRSRITHFYFLDPNRVCVLRVHQPGRRGDRIDRFTARQAEATGRVSHGIELGPLGTLTLRVVRPWFENGQLIGYIELGGEIEHVTEHLGTLFGVEICVAIHKEFLDKGRWREGMAMLGRDANWDRFPESVVVSKTLENVPAALGPHLARGRHSHRPRELEVSVGDRDYCACFWRLTDVAGRHVGEMVILCDVTGVYAALRGTIVTVTLICLTVGTGLFCLFYVFLGRVDRDLATRALGMAAVNEKLRTQARSRARSERRSVAARKHLSAVVEAMPDPFLVIDRDYRIVLANDVVRRLAGDVDPVAAGLRCHQVSHHRDTPCEGTDDPCPLRMVVATKQPVRVTHTHYNAEGEPRVVEIMASPIMDADGEVVEIIEACRDITDRRRAEEDLKATAEDVDRFGRASVSREIRMIDLKREVNEMARKAGIAPPYEDSIAEAEAGGGDA